ncbi:MAG: DUF4912 domain-containing protein [Bacillota bacterium]|jgi:hypothetical protein|nr:DUF4912 domain-containing protein [Clostridia bacterium]
MSIITYLVLLLLIGLVIFVLLLPRKQNDHRPPVTAKPLEKKFTDEFSLELSPNHDYWWKGPVNKKPLTPELPSKYQESKLALLVQNPNCIFAYWELSDDHLENLHQQYGSEWVNGSARLKVFHATDAAGTSFHEILQFDLPSQSNNYYIQVPYPGQSYFVELGKVLASGRYIMLLRSETVTTPRSTVSTLLDENWIPCDIYRYMENISYGRSSADLIRNNERKKN